MKKFILFLLLTVVLVLMFNNSISVFAEENGTVAEEKKIYTVVDINDNFDDSCIIVVMKKTIGGINRLFNVDYFKNDNIESIEDLSYINDPENTKYFDKENFHQILKLNLKEKSKEKVVKAINEIQELESVLVVEPNAIGKFTSVNPNDKEYVNNNQWGLNGINGIRADQAWDFTTGSKNVKVGIIDSGIASHQDLNDNVTNGYDFYNNEHIRTTTDPIIHGTPIAGIIGAASKSNDDEGICGINWEIEMVPLRVYNKITGETDYSSVISAVFWAKNNNIPILNYSSELDIINTISLEIALANYTGLFVCAAGNDYTDIDLYPVFPASLAQSIDKVISVGAISRSGQRASSSNYGDNSVSIYAPGVNIMSTVPGVVGDGTDGEYDYVHGTSMAAPFVTGVAALMLSVNPNLTGAQLKEMILNSSDTIQITYHGSPTLHDVKKLNAHKAVATALLNINNSGQITGLKTGTTFSGVLNIPKEINGITVTEIAGEAFKNKACITDVYLPDTVTTIGASAFMCCANLTNIVIPEGVASIGNFAFAGCDSLSDITIPSSVSSVGVNAFSISGLSITWKYGNNSLTAANFATYLTEVDFFSTVTTIRPYSFNGATNLEDITLPTNIISIGAYAFNNCTSLENITIPSSVYEVGTYAFHNCTNLEITWNYGNSGPLTAANFADKLNCVTFDNNVTTIRANSFAGATNLSSIAIPSGITSIGANAFNGCTALTSIDLPESVTSIGASAFNYCSGLTSITVDTNNTTYKSEGNCLIRKSDNALILGCSTSIIPNTVVSIEANAFNGCTALMSVNIPSSVTSIGANAFSGCTALERVLIDHSDHGITLGSGAFYSTSSNLTILVPYNLSQLYTFSGDWSGYLTKICYYEIYNNQMYQTYIVNFWQPDDYFTVTYYTDHIIIEMININSSDPGTIIDCCVSFYVNTTDEFCVIWSGAYLPESCYTLNGWVIVPYCNEIGGYIEEFVIFPDDYGTMPYISIYDMLFTTAYRGSVIE